MSRHMTLEDRNVIEDALNQQVPLAEIAKRIQKDRSTVSREVKGHRSISDTGAYAPFVLFSSKKCNPSAGRMHPSEKKKKPETLMFQGCEGKRPQQNSNLRPHRCERCALHSR